MKREKYFILASDGASKGNPGKASGGFLIVSPEGDIILEKGFYIGERFTNNDAEYIALLYGIVEALRMGIKKIKIVSDSQVVLRQIKGEYKIRKPFHKLLHIEVMKRIVKFDSVRIEEVKRENRFIKIADYLANEVEKELKTFRKQV